MDGTPTGTRTGTAERWRRGAAAAAGLAGGAWGLAAGPDPAALIAGLVAVAGALVALRRPAIACGLLSAASIAGPVGVGASWIGPGALQLAAAMLALWATHDPFAEEIRREREAALRTRTHGRPG